MVSIGPLEPNLRTRDSKGVLEKLKIPYVKVYKRREENVIIANDKMLRISKDFYFKKKTVVLLNISTFSKFILNIKLPYSFIDKDTIQFDNRELIVTCNPFNLSLYVD